MNWVGSEAGSDSLVGVHCRSDSLAGSGCGPDSSKVPDCEARVPTNWATQAEDATASRCGDHAGIRQFSGI